MAEKREKQAALVPEEEQPYPVPENWYWTRIGCISDVVTGGTPSKRNTQYYDNGTFPFFKPGDLDAGRHVYEATEYLSDAGKAVCRIIPAHATAVCCIGSIGKCGYLEIEGTTNQQINSLIPRIDPLYSYYYCNTPDFVNQLLLKASATTISIVNKSKVESCLIPIPPIPEQQRIAARIEYLFTRLDAAKEKLQGVIDGFELRKAAILHKAFTGELLGIPNDKTIQLEAISDAIRIGPFGNALHKEDYVTDGIPVINPKHIANQQIIPEAKVAITEKKASELTAYRLKTGDIIMGRRGEMGRSAPVTEKENGWLCGTGSLIIRLKSGYIASFYSQIISSHSSIQYLEENCVGSTMKNLNEKIVKGLPVPNYTKEQQKAITVILSSLLEKEQKAKEAAQAALAQIDTIKKTILARAFRGGLGTNDPAEESAAFLLESRK